MTDFYAMKVNEKVLLIGAWMIFVISRYLQIDTIVGYIEKLHCWYHEEDRYCYILTLNDNCS